MLYMRKKHFAAGIAALMLILLTAALLSGCGRTENAAAPSEPSAAEASAPAETGRQNGERFEAVILLEGMEETVGYEHIRNDAIGFEMDYDYERFVRRSDAACECFVSCYDDPEHPENYLTVRYDPRDAGTVAAAIGEVLSHDYEIHREDSFPLERAGSCIRIDASANVGGLTMPDQLQMVYIVPAADGCRVASAHYAIEGAEGFGRRFHCFMQSFAAMEASGEKRLSDEQAAAAIRRYCRIVNPDLESVASGGEAPVYWEVSSSDESRIVVLFRSYTGAQIRYYIDPLSGETYVTEFVPGITADEARTDESLNAWDYID